MTKSFDPNQQMDHVTLAHGGGGRLMSELIAGFRGTFRSKLLDTQLDSALLPVPPKMAGKGRLAFTTDSYVIHPHFFPGGDIGRLAVCGTVNDLSVVGAEPAYISCAFIIEDGFPTADLKRILTSMYSAAKEAGVEIVTGDTKVVEKGHGDGIFINTAGVGFVPAGRKAIDPKSVKAGDAIILSGTLGDHAMTIMSQSRMFCAVIHVQVAGVHVMDPVASWRGTSSAVF
jgi:hydrogenase expression/formation protein HypE